MNSIQFLFNSIFGLYTFLVMLRMWLQFCQADFYHPLSQSVVKLTDPLLKPLRKIVKARKRVDIASLLLVFFLGIVKFALLIFLLGGELQEVIFSNNLMLFPVFGLLTVLKAFGEMLLYVIFLAAILSWFRSGYDALGSLLHQLSAPILTPIRRKLPSMGGLDFSPMLVGLLLLWLNMLMFDLVPGLWRLV